MTPEIKEASGRLIISVLTIVTTVVASTMGIDYRSAERTTAVQNDVKTVTVQNQEILQGISQLLDQKLEATAKAGETNVKLNTTILKRLDALERKIK